MQYSMDKFSTSCDNFGLTVSIRKTEVIYKPTPGKPHQVPTVTVKNQPLADVEKCAYLGITLSRCNHIDHEVHMSGNAEASALSQGVQSHRSTITLLRLRP
jgi:hypothetical protein